MNISSEPFALLHFWATEATPLLVVVGLVVILRRLSRVDHRLAEYQRLLSDLDAQARTERAAGALHAGVDADTLRAIVDQAIVASRRSVAWDGVDRRRRASVDRTPPVFSAEGQALIETMMEDRHAPPA